MHWINAHPSTKFSDLPTALYRLYRVVDSSSFYSSQRKSSAFFLESYMHRVDITESFSAQYPTWIFNFGPYGQLRAVKENSSIILKYATFELCFLCFHGQVCLFVCFFIFKLAVRLRTSRASKNRDYWSLCFFVVHLSIFRILKLLCYFGTYGMYTCDEFL